MDRLNEWFKLYESFTRLRIDEAQELSKRARLETNYVMQEQIYNKLILGTMYVIYNYIVNNKLYLIVNQDFV